MRNVLSLSWYLEMQGYGFNRVLAMEAKINSMKLSDFVVITVKSDKSLSAKQVRC